MNENTYAAMLYPAANRVYADVSIRLLANELRVFDETVLGGVVDEFTQTTIGGVAYVTFSAPELSVPQIDLLSNTSTLYALFIVRDGLFEPVSLRRLDKFDSDLLSIQRYTGKTNELFTKLLLNVTALGSATPEDLVVRRLRVFDPLCGRGTTLNQAMMYGFDASGLDVNGKDFDEYGRFIRTWLRDKRIKHQATVSPIRREHSRVGRRLDITLGVDKQSYRSGETTRLAYVNADTVRSTEFFRANSFDLIVTDAPYGVRHGSTSGPNDRSHKPSRLLADALPGWLTLLRTGGALGISWNTQVVSRAELVKLLTDNGLTVRDSPGYRGFEHRVDHTITRDLLVASK